MLRLPPEQKRRTADSRGGPLGTSIRRRSRPPRSTKTAPSSPRRFPICRGHQSNRRRDLATRKRRSSDACSPTGSDTNTETERQVGDITGACLPTPTDLGKDQLFALASTSGRSPVKG